MDIEYEATFLNINKDEIREKLKNVRAKLIKPEFLQKRFNFIPPKILIKYSWIRVRDEGDKITMSYKAIKGDKIKDQKEINLVIDDFKKGIEFLEVIGCQRKAYQETKREMWNLDGVEICIDEWPFLEPFVEIEGKSEKEVKSVSEKLGFDYSKALFCAVGLIYSKKYDIPPEIIDNEIPEIIFDMENPFLKIKNEFLKDSVSAIIIRKKDDKVFIARRKENKEFSPGLWETIGGRIEKGETAEEALEREVKEELNTDIKSFKFFGDYEYRDYNKLFKTFIVELKKEPIPNGSDFEEWGWFSEEEIEKRNFVADCKKRILDYFKSIKIR
jgi:adenylate cyclase class 2